MKPGNYPPRLVKTGLIVSVLPFVGFGAFLIGRILRTNHDNYKLILPFISFVLLFCAIPVVYVFLRLRKMETPASPASGTVFVIAGITLFAAALFWGWLYMTGRSLKLLPLAFLPVAILSGFLIFRRRK